MPPHKKRRINDPNKKQSKEESLPSWIRDPIIINPDNRLAVADVVGLNSSLSSALTSMNIETLFPVQSVVIPLLLDDHHRRDVCVSAATGSGKTLAYVLPILHTLAQRTIRRLRALVVVPTRDLALQVGSVFNDVLNKADIDLSVGVIHGQHSFKAEQREIVQSEWQYLHKDGEIESMIDILVCTPGRLVEHMLGTAGFTLDHLRYLVVDEADRLLSQDYQGWVVRVSNAIKGTAETPISLLSYPKRSNNVQKMLFSATLTRNPAKMASLSLHAPIYIIPYTRYAVPDSMVECMVVCEDEGEKPMALIQLLNKEETTLCFTSSVETAHRLSRLLEIMNVSVYEYSSALPQHRRTAILDMVQNNRASVVVCSDAMARGIDLSVGAVISYDVPMRLKTYLHRAGRTARAGRRGHVYSILHAQDVPAFRSLLSEMQHNDVIKRHKLDRKLLHSSEYNKALNVLKTIVEGEKRGDIAVLEPLGRNRVMELMKEL